MICLPQTTHRENLCRRAASVPKSAYLRRFTCPLNNAHQARVTLLYALYSESVAICSIKLQATFMPWFSVSNSVNLKKICSVEIKCHCKTSTLQKSWAHAFLHSCEQFVYFNSLIMHHTTSLPSFICVSAKLDRSEIIVWSPWHLCIINNTKISIHTAFASSAVSTWYGHLSETHECRKCNPDFTAGPRAMIRRKITILQYMNRKIRTQRKDRVKKIDIENATQTDILR